MSMSVEPNTGPILGGVLLGLVVLFGTIIVVRLIRRRLGQKHKETDPELAKKADETVQLGAPREAASSTLVNRDDRTEDESSPNPPEGEKQEGRKDKK
jgi:hypothetical protein